MYLNPTYDYLNRASAELEIAKENIEFRRREVHTAEDDSSMRIINGCNYIIEAMKELTIELSSE